VKGGGPRRALWGALAVLLALRGEAHAAAALESIASQAAKALSAPTGPNAVATLVVAAPLASDVAAPRGDELAERVAQLVAGALGGATHAAAQPVTLAQARALAGKAGARLVFAQPAIVKGVLRVTLDAYPTTSNGWDRVRNPEPPPIAHGFVAAPIDAEVRAYLAAIPLEHARVHRAKEDEGEVLAAACGDLDGDGGMELVLVSRTRVASGHLRGGRFVPTKTTSWSALAPRAAVPLREPLGGAAIVRAPGAEGARLLVGITDRGGVALDSSLAPLASVGPLRGIPIPYGAADDACAVPNPESSAFEGYLMPCTQAQGASTPVRSVSTPPRFDAASIADLVRADGVSRLAQAAREPGGKLDLRLGEATQTLADVGAQIALADLDQDGAPEIIASAGAGAVEGEDAITVTSWDGVADPRPRLHLPAPAGVRAVCVCPPEEGGAPALVAVVGSEVWIVR
jgi:hypothetical protein